MACTFEKDLLSAYHDGELVGRELDRVRSHLERCGECRRELEDVRAVSRQLRSVGRVRVPEALRQDLRERIAGPRLVKEPVRHRKILEFSLAAAVSVLIGITAFVVLRPAGREAADSGPLARGVREETASESKAPVQGRKARRPAREKGQSAPVRLVEKNPGNPGPARAERKVEEDFVRVGERGRHGGSAGRDDSRAPEPGGGGGREPAEPRAQSVQEAAKPGVRPARGTRSEEEEDLVIVVVARDTRATDETVNEFLRHHSTDYRRNQRGEWTCVVSKSVADRMAHALREQGAWVLPGPRDGRVLQAVLAQLPGTPTAKGGGLGRADKAREVEGGPAGPTPAPEATGEGDTTRESGRARAKEQDAVRQWLGKAAEALQDADFLKAPAAAPRQGEARAGFAKAGKRRSSGRKLEEKEEAPDDREAGSDARITLRIYILSERQIRGLLRRSAR